MNTIDRIRVEWHVWILDQRLYDMPRASRIARRRELRENLLLAASDIGLHQALINLGNGRVLADQYLEAEFGNAPRASWVAAFVFLSTVLLVLMSLLTESMNAFGEGILAADPSATGSFHWAGVPYLQYGADYTATDGTVTFSGGGLTPLSCLLLLAGTVTVGRLWRARFRKPWQKVVSSHQA